MAEVREYKKRDFIRAEKVVESGRVVVGNGPTQVRAGDYLVYGSGATKVVKGSEFEKEYILVEDEESEARGYSPAGKSVEEVVNFLKENPDEINRVKQLEKKGGSRKGILSYEK